MVTVVTNLSNRLGLTKDIKLLLNILLLTLYCSTQYEVIVLLHKRLKLSYGVSVYIQHLPTN